VALQQVMKKIVYLIIIYIVIGLLFAKHFFTKKTELTFANVETASIFISKNYVKYDFKYSDYKKSWEEPVKNYKSINIHRETMSMLDTDGKVMLLAEGCLGKPTGGVILQ
jgi:hypothetical protein